LKDSPQILRSPLYTLVNAPKPYCPPQIFKAGRL
jgi:hypothetical protein